MTDASRLEAYHLYEEEWESYDELKAAFEWECPDTFNMASYVCDRWAEEPDRVAVYAEDGDGRTENVTYADIQERANRLANYFESTGVSAGDRVGVFLGPRPEVLVGHVAAWKVGAISVPLSTLFGHDALEYRLRDCDVKACVGGPNTMDTLRSVADELPALESVVVVEADPLDGEVSLEKVFDDHDATYETTATDPDDGALIIYTSGTTGNPKGVLHGHRSLLGWLPSRMGWFLADGTTEGEVWWSVIGWSWAGSLGMILPGLFYGVSVVAYDGGKFDPERALDLIERYEITAMLGPPTMLRMIRNVENAMDRYDVSEVKRIVTGGEKIEPETIDWVDRMFDGVAIQDVYGQTESGANIGDYSPLVRAKKDKIGVELPGNEVAILDEQTREPVETGEVGEIAVRYEGNLGLFEEYWNEPEKTARKVQDGWLLTEDLGTVDEDGYFSFETRRDDVIITSGYKVGPEEIEETLLKHDGVDDVGVIGIPHDERGEIPCAYVVLGDDVTPSEPLESELQEFVKDRLAKYEYPREIEFMAELPRTVTGKVRRHDLRKEAGLVDE